MSEKLPLLSGTAVNTAIAESEAQVFGYEINPAGLVIALAIAAVFYLLGLLCWWQTGLGGVWTVVFVALMFIGIGFTAIAAYWHQFGNEQLVAVGSEKLFVGGPKATWAIDWELLDPQAMGFDKMEMTRLRGALQMRVGGQDIKLHLFNPIVFLGDIEGFMHGVLSHLKPIDSDAPDALLEEE